MFTWLVQMNYLLFEKINAEAGRWIWLDNTMIFCADLLIFLWPLLLLLLWGLPYSWSKRPLRAGEDAIKLECRSVILWVAPACLLAYLFNLGVELFVFEPRPFVAHHVHTLVAHAADASFPSDHTAWSFAVVGMLLFSLPPVLLRAWEQRWAEGKLGERLDLLLPLVLMGMAVLMACCIGVARVFVGVHYPGDIVGGALSGLLAARIVTELRRRLARPTQVVIQFVQRLHLA